MNPEQPLTSMPAAERPLVVVAMSGGVDSSVAALRLVREGYRVVGMMLRLWSEPGSEESNRCCTPDAMAQARRVAARLGIPFYAVDVRDRFREVVVDYFLNSYAAGVTPNPCIVCNREIRWGFLYEQARALGAEYLATGHYARVRILPDRSAQLLRGLDPAKDQSYVLSVIPQEKLQRSLFPVGEMDKAAVRELARAESLAPAERPDSQDLCFLAGQDYRGFLQRNAPEIQRPGPIFDRQGRQVGTHSGLPAYTIGQRKGLGIAAPQPLYVIAKDGARNALIVGEVGELGESELVAADINWVDGRGPDDPQEAEVKIRYHARDARALLEPLPGGSARARFVQPVRDITPGQRAVFYSGPVCLGGGTIQG
jgi:tRNA-uridine 2-sulfurtransferase